jgi:hypothetical protein
MMDRPITDGNDRRTGRHTARQRRSARCCADTCRPDTRRTRGAAQPVRVANRLCGWRRPKSSAPTHAPSIARIRVRGEMIMGPGKHEK